MRNRAPYRSSYKKRSLSDSSAPLCLRPSPSYPAAPGTVGETTEVDSSQPCAAAAPVRPASSLPALGGSGTRKLSAPLPGDLLPEVSTGRPPPSARGSAASKRSRALLLCWGSTAVRGAVEKSAAGRVPVQGSTSLRAGHLPRSQQKAARRLVCCPTVALSAASLVGLAAN